jgi:hypothetical protein
MDDAKQQALLTALVTEHFVLQSARGVATSEAGMRASLYLTSLTGALVALGFIAQVGEQFDAFAAAVLPALFLLGEFTYVRLLENSIEDVLLQRSIKRIRRYYLGLHADGAEFFGDAADGPGRRPPTVPGGLGGVAGQAMYHSWVQLLFTAASMVAAINSILGGAGVALLVRRLDLAGEGPAAVVGAGAAVVGFAVHVWYERHRFRLLVDRTAVADQGSAGPVVEEPEVK